MVSTSSRRGGAGVATRAFFLGFAVAPLFLAPLVFFFACAGLAPPPLFLAFASAFALTA